MESTSKPKGRFAPSPSGRMHAGNIFAALVSWLYVKSQGGSIVLRIEDLDVCRSKPQYSSALQKDFESLGLTWDEGPYYQQTKTAEYEEAFNELRSQGLLYPCFCSRADLHSAQAPHRGDSFIYPGTCRNLSAAEQQKKIQLKSPAYRLIVPSTRLSFSDAFQGEHCFDLADEIGDFIVKRADGGFAYQLACAIDDAKQNISVVIRGVDLLSSTPQQLYIKRLLSLKQASFGHIPLLVNEQGRRLSKRDKDADIEEMKRTLKSSEGIVGKLAYLSGMIDCDEAISLDELLNEAQTRDIFAHLRNREEIRFTL